MEDEAVQSDGKAFLTKCESGRVAKATWSGTPPNHEPYKKEQIALKIRREREQREYEDQSDDKQSDEGGQEAADRTPPQRVVLEETIRNTPP